MTALLVLALVLGADSFRVGVGLGIGLAWRRRLAVALAFGLADGLMFLLGLAVGHPLGRALGGSSHYAGAAVLAGYGVWLLVPRPAESDPRWILFGLPIVLGFDNAIAGAAVGWLGVPSVVSAVLLLAASSALLALTGMTLGAAIAERVPFRASLLRGVALIALAAFALVPDVH